MVVKVDKFLIMNPTVEKRLRRQERQISLSLMWSPQNAVVLPFLKDSRLTWMRTPATNGIRSTPKSRFAIALIRARVVGVT